MPRLKHSRGRPLTSKQKEFCEMVAMGWSRSRAYREAYCTNAKPTTIRVEASRLAKQQKIADEIESCRKRLLEALEPARPPSISELLTQLQHRTARKRLNAASELGKLVGLF